MPHIAIQPGAIVADEKPSETPSNPVQNHIDAVIQDLKVWPGTTPTQEDALGRALQDRKVGRIGR